MTDLPVACFNPDCDERFETVEDMVAVPGSDGQSPRNFCESCADRIQRGPPIADGGVPDDVVHERTDRDVTALSKAALVAEWSEICENLRHMHHGEEGHTAAVDRRHELWNEMRARTDADPPECPECDGTRWTQGMGQPKHCTQCGFALDERHQETIEAVDAYWETVQSVPEDQRLVTDGGPLVEDMYSELDTVFARYNDLVVAEPETVVALLINMADGLRDKFGLTVRPRHIGEGKHVVYVGGEDVAGFLELERDPDTGHIIEEDMPEGMEPEPVRDDHDIVPDGGQIEVCPRCDKAKLRARNPGAVSSGTTETAQQYRCANCGNLCDEPARREPKHDPDLSGLAGVLDDAGPDMVTDGGRDQFPCVLCGARYGDRGAALRCCSASARENQPTEATHEQVRDAVGRVDR
ncbi:hypothetical protein [Haloarcula halophila]|uniref:hypothetical protein n=1 Tax=Haloarcula TaxID=2237 RepID=UPI0023E36049|nr:hypothetical protein [Halomicroarcula sp. DFY41]